MFTEILPDLIQTNFSLPPKMTLRHILTVVGKLSRFIHEIEFAVKVNKRK